MKSSKCPVLFVCTPMKWKKFTTLALVKFAHSLVSIATLVPLLLTAPSITPWFFFPLLLPFFSLFIIIISVILLQKLTKKQTAMFVPDPVMSLSISMPKGKQDPNFHKSLAKFEKEDPTFRNSFDSESNQHIISGMGELHLEIYIERMKREYGLQVVVGKPQVAFREGIQKRVEFNYVHKKQSGGRGQYAKIIGYIEPITDASDDFGGRTMKCEFVDDTVGGSVPPEFVPAVEKGMEDALLKGPLVGHKVCGLRFVLTDGGFHPVDSSELAFRLAAKYACHSSLLL